MTETKHKTTVEVAVDDRGLKNLGKTISEALSADSAEKLARSLEKAVSAFERMAELQRRQSQGGGGAGSAIFDPSTGRYRDPRSGAVLGGAAAGAAGAAALSAIPGGRPRGVFPGAQDTDEERGDSKSRWQRFREAGQHYSAVSANFVPHEGMLSSAASGIPFVGGFISGVLQSITQHFAYAVAEDKAKLEATGRTGSTIIGGGGRWGRSVAEMAGISGQVADASGLRGNALQAVGGRLLDYQTFGGVGLGGTGGFMRSVTEGPTGASAERAQEMLQEAVQSGIQMGIRDSDLEGFLQNIAGTVEEIRTHGINLQPETLLAFARQLGATGSAFQGRAGMNAAGGLIQSAGGAVGRGGLAGMIVGSHFGLGHGMGLMQARAAAEADPTRALQALLSSVMQTPGTHGARAFALENLIGQIGGPKLSATQLLQLTRRGLASDAGIGDEARQREEALRAPQDVGFTAQAADMANRRVGVGRQMSGAAIAIQDTEMSMVEGLGSIVQSFTATVREWKAAYDQGGIGGLSSHVMSDLTSAIGNAVRGAMSSATEAFGPGGTFDVSPLVDAFNGFKETIRELIDKLTSMVGRVFGDNRHLLPSTSADAVMG